MTSKAETVEEYLAELPEDRREAISKVREVILANLPKGVEEGMQYGSIGYFVPHSIYPEGYHCDPKEPLPFIGLASQKNHMAVYMFCLYVNEDMVKWFVEEYEKTGRKPDMGASCVRFKKLEHLPVDLIGKAVAKMDLDDFIMRYEMNKPRPKSKKK